VKAKGHSLLKTPDKANVNQEKLLLYIARKRKKKKIRSLYGCQQSKKGASVARSTKT